LLFFFDVAVTCDEQLDGLQKDRQLRVAQIQAMQQREETIKQRVISHCDQQQLPLAPKCTNHLMELIVFVLDRYVSSRPTTMYARNQLASNNNTNHGASTGLHQDRLNNNEMDSMPSRRRSASPVISQLQNVRDSSIYRNDCDQNDELLRPVSSRLSPQRTTAIQSFYPRTSNEITSNSITDSYQQQRSLSRSNLGQRQSNLDDRNMLSTSRSGTDLQERLKRTRMSFSTLREG
jgi:hypothetical protein